MPQTLQTPVVSLPANRVRRSYKGGALLEGLATGTPGRDSERPEDWIASTLRATNPGMDPIEGEGLSWITVNQQKLTLPDLLAAEPTYYLGAAHVARMGSQLGFLAKLLDSSMRLHMQAHPTAAFAQQHLNSRWGKLETYVILAVRPGVDPCIRMGFQHPPTPAEWRRIVMEQDIRAMDACFEPVPVRVGEVWLVPGGLPHAIGGGILMLEVMEPTDLVVRCEFEREGMVVPPAGRFMNRDPDFALSIFDFTHLPLAAVQARYRIAPRLVLEAQGIRVEELIGNAQTHCFQTHRYQLQQGATPVKNPGRARLGIVTTGAGTLKVQGHETSLKPGEKFLLAAAADDATLTASSNANLEVLVVSTGDNL